MATEQHASNGFQTARVGSLQPPMTLRDVGGTSVLCKNKVAYNDMLNLVRLWSRSVRELPDDFCEHVRVTAITRQPVTFLTVDVERIRRQLIGKDRPFDGGPLNPNRWPTQDLFELYPVASMSFPGNRERVEVHLDGQEETNPCGICKGKGKNPCHRCTGSTTVPCTTCHGKAGIACGVCRGTGGVVKGGQTVEPCSACDATGLVPCAACEASGQVKCNACDGSGELSCGKCSGYGTLKRTWDLATEIWCDHRLQFLCPEGWPTVASNLVEDADVLQSHEWRSPGTPGISEEIEQEIPPSIRSAADSLCRTIVQDQQTIDPKSERLSGMRLEVRGTYLLRAKLSYENHSGTLVFGGTTNQVVWADPPKVRQTLLQRFFAGLNRIYSLFGLGETPPLSHDYVRAVRAGQAHVSDPRCVVPALEHHGASVRLNSEGYTITVGASDDSGKSAEAVFEARIVINGMQETTLFTASYLGAAHRDRFPAALAINHRLRVGRVAIIDDPQTKEERFVIVDRRPYESIQTAHLACILIDLSTEIFAIRAEGALT